VAADSEPAEASRQFFEPKLQGGAVGEAEAAMFSRSDARHVHLQLQVDWEAEVATNSRSRGDVQVAATMKGRTDLESWLQTVCVLKKDIFNCTQSVKQSRVKVIFYIVAINVVYHFEENFDRLGQDLKDVLFTTIHVYNRI